MCVQVQSASSGPYKCKSTSRVRSSSQAGSFCLFLSFFRRSWFGWVEIFIRKWKLQGENPWMDGTDGGKCNLGVFFSTLVRSLFIYGNSILSNPNQISRLADGNSLGQTPDPRLNFCRVETGGTPIAVYHGSMYWDLACWKVDHFLLNIMSSF